MQTIDWTKTDMGGWSRYEGTSQDFGPYIIEKEDVRCYSIWWGHHDIGEASSVAGAKSVALNHARDLDAKSNTEEEGEADG